MRSFCTQKRVEGAAGPHSGGVFDPLGRAPVSSPMAPGGCWSLVAEPPDQGQSPLEAVLTIRRPDPGSERLTLDDYPVVGMTDSDEKCR
jgi:hypothetical protein